MDVVVMDVVLNVLELIVRRTSIIVPRGRVVRTRVVVRFRIIVRGISKTATRE